MAIIKPNNNTISAITALPAGVGGKVLQIQTTFKSSVSSITTNSDGFVDITGMSVAITPSASSSKILVQASILYSFDDDTYGSLGGIRFMRDSTGIGIGGQDYASGIVTGDGNSGVNIYVTVPLLFLDSPNTTSATTYKLQVKNSIGGNKTFYVNAKKNGTNYGSSTITVMEIAG
jgi:hypothetical protein